MLIQQMLLMAGAVGFGGEQQSWTNPSNATNNLFHTWTVPAGVNYISAVVIGGGGGGSPAVSYNDGSDEYQTRPGSGGGGGGLTYRNSIPVTPGETLNICVGCGGSRGNSNSSDQKDWANAGYGGHSWIKRGGTNGTALVGATGGQGGQGAGDYDSIGGNAPGGSYTSIPSEYTNAGGTFAQGGTGRRGGHTGWPTNAGSGGGAAGYGGQGGAGGNSGGTGGGVLATGGPATAGSQGAGSGGYNPNVSTQTYGGYAIGTEVGFGGGGVGVDGKGDSGAQVSAGPGKGGSGGSDGAPALVGIGTTNGILDKDGGYYGGGGGGGNYFPDNARKHGGNGGGGAVRIIYPGETYVFPNQDGLPDPGPLNYTTASPNTYSWIVPDGVWSINLYAVGAGGGGGWNNYQGGGGGGAIVWTDGVAVTPGETLTIGIGTGGTGGTQDNGGNQPGGTTYTGLLGQTTFVKRASNNYVFLKAYGGGGSGGRGGEGFFNEGIGRVISGGEGYNYSGVQNQGGGTGEYHWHQGGSSAYKGKTGGGSSGGSGGVGVGITEGYTGAAGESVGSNGGAGGFPGGGGGCGPTNGRGGHGADGALVISWDVPQSQAIGGGSTYIAGKHSINFISDDDEDWIEYTPSDSDGFQLGNGDWTIEFWHRGSSFTYQQYDQRNLQRGNATFIEGLDSSNNTVWKIGASQPSITDTISWYEGTGEVPKYTSTGNECFGNNGADNWRHYCFMRTGNSIQYRYGGTRYYPYNTSDYTTSMNDTSTVKIRIGGGTGTYSKGIHGKLSNVRVVKGTALYVNDTYDAERWNPYTEVESGTVLLCANGSNITDAYWGAGISAGTVTTSGSNNATYSNLHPFDTYDDGN